MENFLDIVLPPLLLFAGVATVCAGMCVLVAGRLRLWAVRRRRIDGAAAALRIAAAGLASAIADGGLSEVARTDVLEAYTQVTAALAASKKEGQQ